MEAVELRIPGSYWDTTIYDGRLYLFARDGRIRVIDWDKLVGSLDWPADTAPTARHFLARGRAWYAPEIQQLLRAPSTFEHFRELASRLTKRARVIPERLLSGAEVWVLDSPAFPHSDVETYFNSLYVGGPDGIHQIGLSNRQRYDWFERVSDVPALRISASYGSMAIAAGSEGLFDQPLAERYRYMPQLSSVSDEHCQSASWARFDIVGSSPYHGGGYLAAYSNPKDRDSESDERWFVGLAGAEALFGRRGDFIFGAGDKVVMVAEGEILTSRWNPYRRRNDFGLDLDRSLVSTQKHAERRLRGPVLDATASVFGYVVEFDDALMVFANDETFKKLPEPVAWRCFPRSARYVNQLHVTLDDHVRIYAFVHDYFLVGRDRGPSTVRPRGPSGAGLP